MLAGLMGHGGIGPKARYSLFERFWSFFEITRPFLLLMADISRTNRTLTIPPRQLNEQSLPGSRM